MAHIVSFYSFKGGVGRSVLLANTAAILAKQGFRVVCLDFDLEAGGLHTIFNVQPKLTLQDMLSSASCPPIGSVMIDLTEEIPEKNAAGKLWLLPSVSESHKLNAALEAGHDMSMVLSRIVESIEDHCNPHFILVDTRSGFAEIAAASLRNADSLIIALRPNRQNAEGLRFFLDIISNIRDPPETFLVVTQVPQVDDAVSRVKSLEKRLGENRKFDLLIPYDLDLAIEEKVFVISSPTSKSIKHYEKIADWLDKRFKDASGGKTR